MQIKKGFFCVWDLGMEEIEHPMSSRICVCVGITRSSKLVCIFGPKLGQNPTLHYKDRQVHFALESLSDLS